jgi:hypothetical protein
VPWPSNKWRVDLKMPSNGPEHVIAHPVLSRTCSTYPDPVDPVASSHRPSSAIAALLAGFIDYAGLFPPAGLELQPALSTFAAHRSGPHAGILRSFVTPSSLVPELVAELEADSDAGLPFSVLTSYQDADGAIAAGRDAEAARKMRLDLGGQILSFESRVLDVPGSSIEWRDRLRRLCDALAGNDSSEQPILFIEPSLEPGSVAQAARAVAELRGEGMQIGLKIRTGGLEPDAFPSADTLAGFVLMCASHDVPFKATAGLHHPLAHLDRETGGEAHGFLNLFVASALIYGGWRDAQAVSTLLRATDIRDFEFGDDHLAWRGETASRAEVLLSRRQFAISVGSCSIDEPLDDLRELGLTPTGLAS